MRFTHGCDFSPTGLRVFARSRSPGRSPPRPLARLHAVGRLPPGGGARGRRRPPLFDRGRDGVILTPAGRACWLERSEFWTSSTPLYARRPARQAAAGPVRLGAFATAAAGLVPRALASLPRELKVTLREGDHAGADAGAARGHARPRDPRSHAAVPAAGHRVSSARAARPFRSASWFSVSPRATRSRAPARSRSSSSRARSGSRAGPTPAIPCSAYGPGWRSVPTFATSCATG